MRVYLIDRPTREILAEWEVEARTIGEAVELAKSKMTNTQRQRYHADKNVDLAVAN